VTEKTAPKAADVNCLAEWWKFHTHVQVTSAEMGVGIKKKKANKFILGQKVPLINLCCENQWEL